MVKVERIDNEDSFVTTFVIETALNQYQEISVPIFLADEAEIKIKAMNFNTEKAKKGKSTVIT